MAEYDWDKEDSDLEDMIDDDDEEVVDFEDLDEKSSFNPSKSSHDDEDDEQDVKFSKPPSENEALRMMKTFNSIYDTATELAATMAVVISEARGVQSLAKRSSGDIKEITAAYEAGVIKINKQIAVAQKYFEINKNIAKDLSSMKDELRGEFGDLNSSFVKVHDKYIKEVTAALEGLSFKLNNFSQSMDFSGFEKVIKAEIEKVIKTSSIDRVQAAFDSVDKSFFLLEESVVRLAGADKKKGLLEEFREEVYLLDDKLKKIKFRSSFLGIAAAFLIGVAVAGGGVFYYMSAEFNKQLSLALAEHTVSVNEAWMKKR